MIMVATMTDRKADIRQIEHDLRNLQRRYAALDRSARRMKMRLHVFVATLVALIVAGVATGNGAALFVPTMLLVMTGGLAYACRHWRWIDLTTWTTLGILSVGIKRTEAEAVEDLVAERVARLARLKGTRA